jgi:hypothetical protein
MRYWFAVAAAYDFETHPQRLVGYWHADDPVIASLLDAAVEEDALRWHPEFWPFPGITVGRLGGPDSTSRIRVWMGNHPLWERALGGKLTGGYASWYVHRGRELGYFGPPGHPDTAWTLLAQERLRLDASNSFELPAGSWLLQHLFDLRSGRLVATRVRVDQAPDVERIYRSYDARTGAVSYERIHDFFAAGGRAIGAREEHWLRRIERWFDVRTGRVQRERVARSCSFSECGTNWPTVDRKKALAAGPPRSSWR